MSVLKYKNIYLLFLSLKFYVQLTYLFGLQETWVGLDDREKLLSCDYCLKKSVVLVV